MIAAAYRRLTMQRAAFAARYLLRGYQTAAKKPSLLREKDTPAFAYEGNYGLYLKELDTNLETKILHRLDMHGLDQDTFEIVDTHLNVHFVSRAFLDKIRKLENELYDQGITSADKFLEVIRLIDILRRFSTKKSILERSVDVNYPKYRNIDNIGFLCKLYGAISRQNNYKYKERSQDLEVFLQEKVLSLGRPLTEYEAIVLIKYILNYYRPLYSLYNAFKSSILLPETLASYGDGGLLRIYAKVAPIAEAYDDLYSWKSEIMGKLVLSPESVSALETPEVFTALSMNWIEVKNGSTKLSLLIKEAKKRSIDLTTIFDYYEGQVNLVLQLAWFNHIKWPTDTYKEEKLLAKVEDPSLILLEQIKVGISLLELSKVTRLQVPTRTVSLLHQSVSSKFESIFSTLIPRTR